MLSKLLKKNIIAAMMGCVVLASVAPITAEAATIGQISKGKPGYGVVNTTGSSVTVYSSPSSTTQVGVLADDSEVMIIGHNGDYYKVMCNSVSMATGYVPKSVVNFIETTDYYLWANLSDGYLNMRSQPNASSSSIAQIPDAVCFAYKNQPSTTWYGAVFANKSGYTSATYAERIPF